MPGRVESQQFFGLLAYCRDATQYPQSKRLFNFSRRAYLSG